MMVSKVPPSLRAGREAQTRISYARYSPCLFERLGAHDDGDQVTLKMVFSQEANLEAANILRAKSNILNIYGQNMRRSTNEAVQTLYMLTARR